MGKYFRVHNYSSEMKAHQAIYNLNGKSTKWCRDLKNTEKDEVKEIIWSVFWRIFLENYMTEIFFNERVKEFHELRMGS